MTKQDRIRKDNVVRMMYHTAIRNGKQVDLLDMYRVAERLHRLETTLSRLAEEECDSYYYNRYWKNGINPNQERKEILAEKIIAEEIGCKCYTQRDPRGYTIRMYLVDSEGRPWFNQWDGETAALNW